MELVSLQSRGVARRIGIAVSRARDDEKSNDERTETRDCGRCYVLGVAPNKV